MTAASDGEAITGLWFDGQKYFGSTIETDCFECDLPVFNELKKWLDIYFAGNEPEFMPDILIHTTPFREAVWKILAEIPYGRTVTYGEIAEAVSTGSGGKRVSARAVGGAVGHNAISLIIPCHRVVGSDGSLTGYAGGIEKKIKLLALEKVAFDRKINFCCKKNPL